VPRAGIEVGRNFTLGPDASRYQVCFRTTQTGANGRFKSGQVLDVGAEGIGVYNTMLAAMGVMDRLGPVNRKGRAIDAIRA
jgi:hypothetical protein